MGKFFADRGFSFSSSSAARVADAPAAAGPRSPAGRCRRRGRRWQTLHRGPRQGTRPPAGAAPRRSAFGAPARTAAAAGWRRRRLHSARSRRQLGRFASGPMNCARARRMKPMISRSKRTCPRSTRNSSGSIPCIRMPCCCAGRSPAAVEAIAWRNAAVVNTPEAYRTYLAAYPSGNNASEALRLRERPRVTADRSGFHSARSFAPAGHPARSDLAGPSRGARCRARSDQAGPECFPATGCAPDRAGPVPATGGAAGRSGSAAAAGCDTATRSRSAAAAGSVAASGSASAGRRRAARSDQAGARAAAVRPACPR